MTTKVATLKAPVIPVEHFELACGARLLVSLRPGASVCAASVHLRGGHSLDPVGKEGTALLTGRLLDRGTRIHDEEQLAALLETAGGSLNGSSSGLSASIANDSWKLLLELLSEVVTQPTYPKARFERERKRLLDRLLVDRDEPRVRAGEMFRRLVYGDHWLGRPDYGSPASIESLQRRDLVAFHKKNWCASRAVIAVCGDIDARKVKRFLDRSLADWPAGKALGPPNTTFPAIEPRCDAYEADRQQVHLYLGHLGVRRKDPDYPALVVMDHILGTGPGFTNRIARRLRDELGLAYTVHAAIHDSAGVMPGMFTAYIGTSPKHVETAVEGFQREIRRLQKKLVDPEELELARSYLTGSFVLGFERAHRRANHLIFAYRNDMPADYLQKLVESFATVTREEVREVARKHLFPAASCLVAGGPVKRRTLARLLTV